MLQYFLLQVYIDKAMWKQDGGIFAYYLQKTKHI